MPATSTRATTKRLAPQAWPEVYHYRYSFNGFAAGAHRRASARIATPTVRSVSRDELRTLDTSSTPAFLGLDQPDGLWEQPGGRRQGRRRRDHRIVDGGIWPESLSFSDRTGTWERVEDRKLDDDQTRWHVPCAR